MGWILTEIEDYRGTIPCPFCHQKTMVKKNAWGETSHAANARIHVWSKTLAFAFYLTHSD